MPLPVDTDPNALVVQYLRTLADAHFWGTLALKLEGGLITHLRKEENLKPNELAEFPRSNHGREHAD